MVKEGVGTPPNWNTGPAGGEAAPPKVGPPLDAAPPKVGAGAAPKVGVPVAA